MPGKFLSLIVVLTIIFSAAALADENQTSKDGRDQLETELNHIKQLEAELNQVAQRKKEIEFKLDHDFYAPIEFAFFNDKINKLVKKAEKNRSEIMAKVVSEIEASAELQDLSAELQKLVPTIEAIWANRFPGYTIGNTVFSELPVKLYKKVFDEKLDKNELRFLELFETIRKKLYLVTEPIETSNRDSGLNKVVADNENSSAFLFIASYKQIGKVHVCANETFYIDEEVKNEVSKNIFIGPLFKSTEKSAGYSINRIALESCDIYDVLSKKRSNNKTMSLKLDSYIALPPRHYDARYASLHDVKEVWNEIHNQSIDLDSTFIDTFDNYFVKRQEIKSSYHFTK